MQEDEWHPDSAILRRLFFTGLPMALQFSITAIGSIVIQVAVNSFGSGIIAAITAAQKLQMFFTQPLETMGITMATYCGQNMGAKKMSRVKTGLFQANVIVIGYSIVAFVFLYFTSDMLAMLFIRKEELEILPYIRQYMIANTIFFPALGILLVVRNSIQGLGFTVAAMAAGTIEMIARCVVALFFVKRMGFEALCLSNPAAWVSAALLLLAMFWYIWKFKLRQFRDEEQDEIKQQQKAKTAVC